MFEHRLKSILSVLLLSMSLSACQTLPSNWSQQTNEKITASLEEVKDSAVIDGKAIPEDVTDALLPPLSVELPKEIAAPLESRFDFSVNNAPAKQVFRSLVEGTPYSVSVDSDVRGRISLQLKDVTLEEAFNVIRDTYGFQYTRHKNRFSVYGDSLRTKIFKVNYLNLSRRGSSTTSVSSGQLTQSSTNVEVKTDIETNFWKNLKDSLDILIGNENGHSVIVNPQAGLAIVRATAKEIRLVSNYLDRMHSSVNRQVILEAKILEVELSDAYQSGINWSKMFNAQGYDVNASQIGGGTVLGGGASDIAGNSVNNLATTQVDNATTSAFGGVFSLALQGQNFGAFIELLQTQGSVQVLSSPRVSTVNNQKAVIKVGGDEYYVTGIQTAQSITSGTTTSETPPTVEVLPFFSGIALDVTPQIDENNNIILHLHPTVSEVKEKSKSFTVFGRAYTLPLATSSIRETDNLVRASSGQVIVVGGLMKEATTDEDAAVPFFGKIPLLGNLFKHKKVVRVKKELVVMVKPTIIETDAYWSADAGNSLDRIVDMSR